MRLALLLPLLQGPTKEPGETVVTSPRSTAPATETGADRVVVTAEQLAATGERSLPRMLGKAAGVWLQETNLGGGSPLIQGLSGNQVLLVLDGVRMNDATTRTGVNQMLNGIEPATVERIEVIRGPRSVLYGSDALGGVVLVWTKTHRPSGDDPAAAGLHGALEGHAETAAEGYAGAAEIAYGWKDHGLLGIAGYHDWHTLHSADGEVENTGYEGGSYFGSWQYRLDDVRSLRTTSMITRDYDVPRTDRLNVGFGQTQPSNSEYDFKLQDRQRFVVAYDDRSGGALADVFEARASFRYYKEQRKIRAFGDDIRRLEQDTTNTVGLGLDLKKALGEKNLLTYGVDADFDDVDSSRLDVDVPTGVGTPNDGAFAPDSQYFSSGLFVQDEITSFAPWDVTVGARWSYYTFGFEDITTGSDEDGNFDSLSGSLSAGRPIGKDVRLVGTVARGFRAPNLAELARDATVAEGDEIHNADLDPETSLYGELALDFRKPTWNGALAVFHNTISDVVGSVVTTPGPPGGATLTRENIGTLEVFGALLRGWTRLGGSDSPWSAEATAEYAHGQQYSDFVDPITGEKTFNDEPGQRIPPLHGWVGLRCDVGPGWFGWIEATTNWAAVQDRLSPQDLGDPRIDPDGTDGWVTLDLDVGGPIGDAGGDSRWSFGVHNVLDEEYRVHGSGTDGAGIGLVVAARWSR